MCQIYRVFVVGRFINNNNMRSAPTQTHDNARWDERVALYSEAEAAVLIFFRIESGRAVPLLCVLYITYVLYCIMLCYHVIFFII